MRKQLLSALGLSTAMTSFGQLYTPSGATNSVTNGSTSNVGIGTDKPISTLSLIHFY